MGLISDYFTGSGQARAQRAARDIAGQNFVSNLAALHGANSAAADALTGGTDAAIHTLEGSRDAAGATLGGGRDAALGILGESTASASRALGSGRDTLDRALSGYDALDGLADRYGTATGLLFDALGINGEEGLGRSRAAMGSSLATDFELEQGLEAINRARAARGAGTVSGGNIDRDTQIFGQNLAASRTKDYLDRLYGMIGPELQATGASAAGRAGVLGQLAALYGQEAGLQERSGANRAQLAADTANRLADLARGAGGGVAALQSARSRELAALAETLGRGEIDLRRSYGSALANSLLGEAQARAAAGGNIVGIGLKGLDLLKSLAGSV